MSTYTQPERLIAQIVADYTKEHLRPPFGYGSVADELKQGLEAVLQRHLSGTQSDVESVPVWQQPEGDAFYGDVYCQGANFYISNPKADGPRSLLKDGQLRVGKRDTNYGKMMSFLCSHPGEMFTNKELQTRLGITAALDAVHGVRHDITTYSRHWGFNESNERQPGDKLQGRPKRMGLYVLDTSEHTTE